MQPPPRKVKETQEVKVAFSEQVARLQSKQQQESELLEDIRSFSKQRASIEREYGQALQRLAMQYQKKDWHKGKRDTVNSRQSVFAVWKSLIEATAQSGALRSSAAESYRALTAEILRTIRGAKEQRDKKGLEKLQRVQVEVVDGLRELHKVKKHYYQLSHIASVAREKAADAQLRSKKGDHGIFHFRTGMQKLTGKLNARLAECVQRLTDSRNEYLLTLVAINSHHQHYLSTELPVIMQTMDGDLYDQLREHFTLLCRTEIDTCCHMQAEFGRICEDSCKVTREHNVQLLLQDCPAFSRVSTFHFQGAPSDQVCSLQQQGSSSEGGSCLDKEASKWSTKAAKDYKIIIHGQRALETLERRFRLLSEETNAGVEQRMAEVKESIRKAQVSRVKAESRLGLLASAGAEVERWVGSAMAQAEEELERERRLSEARMSSGDISDVEEEFDFTDFEDYEDGDIFIDANSCQDQCGYPLPCKVLYSYQGCQADELSITEGEELQVIEDGDMEDWLKAQNAVGQVGYVPERYLQFLWSPEEGSVCSDHGSPQLDWSFNSSGSSASGVPNTELEGLRHFRGTARALYEYCGQGPEELSFPEGALIRLLRCRQGQVDDGFWEGELGGHVGVFPSVVVELLGEGEDEGDEEVEESLPAPTLPAFSPPIHIPAPPRTLRNASPCLESWSARGTPPSDREDTPQVLPLETAIRTDSRIESGSSVHSSPGPPVRKIRPARAAPLPPRQSPML